MVDAIQPDLCKIRLMTLQDVDTVAEIENRSYPYPWPQTIFADSLLAGFLGQVITYNGQICGYIFTQHAAQECHILNICIAPQYRGYGLAARLLGETLANAVLQGDKRAYLEVRVSNQIALGLYEKFGFLLVGRRRDYYPLENGKEDALLLTKELEPEL